MVGSTTLASLAPKIPNIWAEPEEGDRCQAWRSARLMRGHRHRCALSTWERTDAPAATNRLLSCLMYLLSVLFPVLYLANVRVSERSVCC